MTHDEIMTMEAGSEIDALVAKKVMGWTAYAIEGTNGAAWLEPREGFIEGQWTGYLSKHIQGFTGNINTRLDDGGTLSMNVHGTAWAPSKKIAHSWQVMERLYTDGWIVGIGNLAQKPRGWRCELCNMWADDFERCPTDIEANAGTAPLAICRAALLATM
jgi:hypothetical protein